MVSLPFPNLDDRRFQDIVDEAKRRMRGVLPGVDAIWSPPIPASC